jgi:hypothetical protein
MLVLTICLATALSLTSCGSSGASNSGEQGVAYDGGAQKSQDALSAGEDEYGYDADEMAVEDVANGGAGNASSTNFTSTENTPAGKDKNQKLIYSSDVSVDTTDYKKSVAALRELMTVCEAFAEYENEYVYSGEDLHSLQVTLRVPVTHYDELMAGMDGLGGTVTNRSSRVTNITRSYADNEAVIEGLEIQEKRLLEMMEQASTVEDMLLVEQRLSEVQTELNRAKTSRESMDTDVSLSTVTVSISEVRYETTTAHTSYLSRVTTAFQDMSEGFVEWLGDLFIGLIYAIPAIVIIGGVVVLLRRRRLRRGDAGRSGLRALRDWRERRAQKHAAQAPTAPQAADDTTDAEHGEDADA